MFPIIGDVVIRTNDFATTLKVNAPLDTVYHYGNTSLVDIISINNASYHYFNTLGRLKVNNGHAVGEPGSAVITPMDMDGEETAASIEIKEGAKVYTEGDYVKLDNGVADGHVEDCGAGHHDFGEKIIVDNHVYELCKCCGYTMITVQDQLGNETKQSKNVITVDEEGNKTVTENVTPILTFETETIISSTAVAEGTNYTIATETNEKGEEVEKVLSEEIEATSFTEEEQSCEHNFVGTVTLEATCTHTGIKTFACDKCGTSYNVTLAKAPHKYYDEDPTGLAYEPTEVCKTPGCGHVRGEIVAKIGNSEYKTLSSAIAACPDNEITTITMIANDALTQDDNNACWTIGTNKNIVIDLNGYTIKVLVTKSTTSQTILNKGTLTIKDSSDINKDGTGTGLIVIESAKGAAVGNWPECNYVSNTITNTGNLTVQSGCIFNGCYGNIAFAIDNQGNGKTTVNGGYIESKYASTLRLYSNGNGKTELNLNGGTVASVYFHGGTTSSTVNTTATLNMKGGQINSIYSYVDNTTYGGLSFFVNISKGTINGLMSFVDSTPTSNINLVGGKYASKLVSQYVLVSNGQGGYKGGTYTNLKGTIIDELKESGYTVIEAAKTGHDYYYYNGYDHYTCRDDGYCGGYTISQCGSEHFKKIENLEGYYDILGETAWNYEKYIDFDNYTFTKVSDGWFEIAAK